MLRNSYHRQQYLLSILSNTIFGNLSVGCSCEANIKVKYSKPILGEKYLYQFCWSASFSPALSTPQIFTCRDWTAKTAFKIIVTRACQLKRYFLLYEGVRGKWLPRRTKLTYYLRSYWKYSAIFLQILQNRLLFAKTQLIGENEVFYLK